MDDGENKEEGASGGPISEVVPDRVSKNGVAAREVGFHLRIYRSTVQTGYWAKGSKQ